MRKRQPRRDTRQHFIVHLEDYQPEHDFSAANNDGEEESSTTGCNSTNCDEHSTNFCANMSLTDNASTKLSC